MLNAKIWFILSQGQTDGPYEPEEVEQRLPALKDAQIWGRGHTEWVTPLKWRQLLRDAGHLPKTPADAIPQGLWRVRRSNKEHSPLRYPELLKYLKEQRDLTGYDVMPDTGSGQWRDVYSVPRLVEDLGISRRVNTRVPIVGNLTYKLLEAEHTCRVISISEGGLGVNDAKNLQIGVRIRGEVTSPNLYVAINSALEVVYVSSDGYAGLQFIDLPDEFKNSIIEYVNKFAIHS